MRRASKTGRKKRVRRRMRPKVCRFCEDRVKHIDFKEIDVLRRFVTEKGRMIPSRITGNCKDHQKILAVAIKRARNLALLR